MFKWRRDLQKLNNMSMAKTGNQPPDSVQSPISNILLELIYKCDLFSD